ncbi:MAG: hydrogen peroxide-dependent heme synthase, partial [Myxococcota bacterium]
DFRRVCWNRWRDLSDARRQHVLNNISALLEKFENVDRLKTGAFGLFAVAGHRADFLFLQLRSTLKEIIDLERALDCVGEDLFVRSHSFVSVVELSDYTQDSSSELSAKQQQAIQARLFPVLPATKYVCFYPMNKLRQQGSNWYLLPLQERQKLMKEHGMSGRKFAGRVTQMISGAMGLDDWEWGVTLFADNPVTFKQVVATMRFDEVSARYGEFGPFYVGNRIHVEQFLHLFDHEDSVA